MRKLMKACGGILYFLNICFLCGIVIITGLQIFTRYLFGFPFIWAEEVSQFFLIFIVFLGTSIVEKEELHIKVEYIYGKISKKIAKLLRIICKTFSLLIAITIICGVIQFFPRIVNTKSPGARIPLTWIFTIIISGAILWALFSIYALINTVYRKKE